MTLLLANMNNTFLAVVSKKKKKKKKLSELENELAFRDDRIRALRFETNCANVQLNSFCQIELQRRGACQVEA